MTTDATTRSAFCWYPGGWFGAQLGCTLWLFILGGVLRPKDSLASWLCIGSFVVLNAWGLYLWSRRKILRAYAGLQLFLLGASLVIALIVVVVNSRGLSEPPAAGGWVSTYLPYWVIAVAPVMMLLFFIKERRARRGPC